MHKSFSEHPVHRISNHIPAKVEDPDTQRLVMFCTEYRSSSAIDVVHQGPCRSGKLTVPGCRI